MIEVFGDLTRCFKGDVSYMREFTPSVMIGVNDSAPSGIFERKEAESMSSKFPGIC